MIIEGHIVCNNTLFSIFPFSYVGRKRMQVQQPEQSVEGVNNLVVADYSYWTLAYALSQQGARKLLDAQPLTKMLPVDEFLPIMFDKHPKSVFTSALN